MMEYKVPEEMFGKIPEHFWPAFAGELVSTFGLTIFRREECTDFYALNYVSGTNGWNAALRMTCKKLDIKWLFDYYDKLKWWESDMFDGEFEDMLIKKFVEADDNPEHTYYKWLIGDNSEE